MKSFIKFTLKALLVLFLILIAGLFFVKWRMDHEVTSITPFAMNTEDVDLTPHMDSGFVRQTPSPSGEP